MRATLVYALVAIGMVMFLTFSNNTQKKVHTLHRRSGPGRRLVVRVNHSRVAFDPIVADLKQRQEDREWEKEYIKQHHPQLPHNSSFLVSGKGWHNEHNNSEADAAWDDQHYLDHEEESEDYLNDEDRFNITHRLTVLFPFVDVNPRDGFISLAELHDWHLQQATRSLLHRTDREMETHDANKDGLLTFKEYLSHLTDEQLANNSTEHGEAGWWKEQFECADEDGDGALNHTELNNFLHPEDSKNEKLLRWMCKEKIRERDEDKDGKLDFAEFDNGAYEIIKQYDEYEHNSEHSPEHVPSSHERFAELDKNKDGFLTEDELEPILHKLHPGEISYARYQAQYLMYQADANKDNRLTLEEMLEHPYTFYNTAYGDDDDDDDYTHDEFR
eukprot:Gb_04968 [translate_table: standard]